MSSSDGPVRRRRIAGESKPAAPVKKAPVKKAPPKNPPTKNAAAKKAPVKKTQAKKATASKTQAKRAAVKTSIVRAVSTKKVAIQKSQPTAVPVPVPVASRTPTNAPAPARPIARPAERTPDTRGSARPPNRELRWLVPAALIAIVALVAGSWFAVDRISNRNGGGDVTTSNEQASAAAGTAAQTIFSFTYDKLPQHLTASKALMTKSFAKQFDKIAPALTELAPQRKIQVQAVTRDAGAIACGDSCSSTKANILIFVDQARLIGGSKEPTVFGNRITVSMVKQHGTWLVADIRAL